MVKYYQVSNSSNFIYPIVLDFQKMKLSTALTIFLSTVLVTPVLATSASADVLNKGTYTCQSGSPAIKINDREFYCREWAGTKYEKSDKGLKASIVHICYNLKVEIQSPIKSHTTFFGTETGRAKCK
jgi:hypothetical protein